MSDLKSHFKDHPYDLSEHPDWKKKYPLGPVHWDVRDKSNGEIHTAVPANELPVFLETKGWLKRW